MKNILIDILSVISVLVIVIILFLLLEFINSKCLEQIILLWPGHDTFTYPFILSGIYLLVFTTISIVISTFVTLYQCIKGKIKEKFDIFLTYFAGVTISFSASVGMFFIHLIWFYIFGLTAMIFTSSAKGYIDEQYRKYNKIPVLFTKEKISVSIKSETKRIYIDTELKHWTCESQIENDGYVIECYPIDPDEWQSEPVFPEEMWVDLNQPVKIDFFIQIDNKEQEICSKKSYHVNLNYDDFKNGKAYNIESIISDRNNLKAKFITTFTFELDLPIQIAKDYINPFKEIEFVTINK